MTLMQNLLTAIPRICRVFTISTLRLVFAVVLVLLPTMNARAQLRTPTAAFTIAQLKYGGGGDWYANPSSLPNLLEFLTEQTSMDVTLEPARVSIMDNELFGHPFLYMTGHGNVRLMDEEVSRLRHYLTSGGFLHVDDNYGLDESFRREIAKVFPEAELVELPFDHGIYHAWFDFPNGPPKIHQHDGQPAKGYGIYYEGRIVVYYTYESDLGDGWEDQHIHNDPEPKRQAALRMGTNIVVYSLTQGAHIRAENLRR
jgi:hypothetical protein